MENLLSLRNDSYHVVNYNATSLTNRTQIDPLIHYMACTKTMSNQARFWMSLIHEVHTCDMNPMILAPHVHLFSCRNARSIDDCDTLCKKLSLGNYNAHRAKKNGGLLTLADKHEKRGQLVKIVSAIDHLITSDPRRDIQHFISKKFEVELMRVYQALVVGLFGHVLPLALAALWLWKASERRRPLYEQDEFLINHLWLSILKLRAVMTPLTPEQRYLGAKDFKTIVPPEVSVVDPDTPITEYKLNDLWLSIRSLSWSTSAITYGTDTCAYMDLLWHRLTILSSVIGDEMLFDRPNFCELLDNQMYRINDKLLIETERIFFFMFEARWIFAILTATTTIEHDHVFARTWRDNMLTTNDGKSIWNTTVSNVLTEGMGEFVRVDFGKRIWWLNGQCDDMENYRIATRTVTDDQRRATMRLFKERFDIITSTSALLLSILWRPANDCGDTCYRQWLANKDDMQARGTRWQCIWELSEMHSQRQKKKEELSMPYIIEMNSEGVRIFKNKKTGARLRAQDAEVAAIMFSRITALAAKAEFDSIQESVLETILQKTREEYSSKVGNNCAETKQWPLVYNARKENLTLLQVCGAQTPIEMASAMKPLFIRLFNEYMIYDGKKCIYHSPFIEDALYMWTHHVEGEIIKQLHAYAEIISHANEKARREIILQVRRLLMHVPPVLRACFNMERDLDTGLTIADRYYHNAPGDCRWRESYLKTTTIWKELIEGTEYDRLLNQETLAAMNGMNIVDW